MGQIADAFVAAFRAFQTDGVPASGTYKPEKAIIQALGTLIENKVISVGTGLGLYEASSDLPALPGPGDAKLAVVSTGEDAGFWEYSGSGPWTQATDVNDALRGLPGLMSAAANSDYQAGSSNALGVTPAGLTFLGLVSGAEVFTLNDATSLGINDISNVLGGGAFQLYLPLSVYFKRGTIEYNGAVGNAASSTLTSYAQLALSSTGVSYVWFDLSNHTYNVTSYSAGLDINSAKAGNLILIAVTRAGRIIWSRFPVREADDFVRSSQLTMLYPLVKEGGNLLVPSYFVQGEGTSGATQRNPISDGSRYFEIALATTTSHFTRIYHDELAAAAGSTPVVKSVQDNGAGSFSGFKKPTIARTVNGKVETPFQIVGDVPGGSVSNQCAYGKNTDAMPILGSGNLAVAVTGTNLTALGFTRGIGHSAAGAGIYGGFKVPDARLGGSAFGRICLQTDTANSFGANWRVYFRLAGTVVSNQPMAIEKVLSTTEAIVSGKVTVPTSAFDEVLLGVDGVAGVKFIITGHQFHHSGASADWIMRSDYPSVLPDTIRIAALEGASSLPSGTDLSPIVSDEVFVTSASPAIIYPLQTQLYRASAPFLRASLQSHGLPLTDNDFVESMGEPLYLPYDKAGSSALLSVRGINSPDNRWTISQTVRKKALPVAGTAKNILLFGDSLTNRFAWLLNQVLTSTAFGYAPTFLGTMHSQDQTNGNQTGPLCEGREGWRTTDYLLNRLTGAMPTSILAAGDEATYLAAAYATQNLINPYMQLAASSSSAAPTITWTDSKQYKFDLDFWRTRFSIATPDVIVLNLCMNDFIKNQVTSLADVAANLPIILNEIRRVWPTVPIILWAVIRPFTTTSNASWQAVYAPILKAIVSLYRSRKSGGDTNIHLCDVWNQQSWEGFPLNTGTTDSGTGITTTTMVDDPHPMGTSRTQNAYALARAVACLV